MPQNTINSQKFPDGFLWGTATAAHQVEGNNKNNDWWVWEKKKKEIPDSETACDSYNLYKEDINLARNYLHNNIYRFSIEWSRIEKEEGVFDEKEIEHYFKVLTETKKSGLKTMVTLHHFTNPIWFAKLGGWEKKSNVRFFDRFVEFCVKNYGDLIDYWIVINEPNGYATMSFLKGIWPPEKRSVIKTISVYLNLISAHKSAYNIIHRHLPHAQVSSTINMVYYMSNKIHEKILGKIGNYLMNYSFIILSKKCWDFLGINYYYTFRVTTKNIEETEKFTTKDALDVFRGKRLDIGLPMHPIGFYYLLKDVWKKYKLPIIITENGIAEDDESIRVQFIKDNITWLKQAIEEGVNIKGYIYWSLMDNIEWGEGKRAKFGLFKTEYKTQKRTPRKSAEYFSKVSASNSLVE